MQIVAGIANGLRFGTVEQHLDAASSRHAHRLPALLGDGDARLVEGDGDQLLLIVAIPGGEQGVAEHGGAGAPCLASMQRDHVPDWADFDSCLRWLRCPHAPSAARRR
ncbi:hypothetical protein D3C81_1833760 [compost metagenome]